MSRQGFKSAVYHGETFLGELDAVPVTGRCFQFPNNEIRIHHISPVSERCPPLSVLQTISSFSVCCKLESSSPVEQSHLINLHASCFYELKVPSESLAQLIVGRCSEISVFEFCRGYISCCESWDCLYAEEVFCWILELLLEYGSCDSCSCAIIYLKLFLAIQVLQKLSPFSQSIDRQLLRKELGILKYSVFFPCVILYNQA